TGPLPPGRLGVFGGGHRLLQIVPAGNLHITDHVVAIRRIDARLHLPGGGGHPLSIDVVEIGFDPRRWLQGSFTRLSSFPETGEKRKPPEGAKRSGTSPALRHWLFTGLPANRRLPSERGADPPDAEIVLPQDFRLGQLRSEE